MGVSMLLLGMILGTGFGNAMIIWAAGIYNVSSFTDTLEKEEMSELQMIEIDAEIEHLTKGE
jgi:hypothetical protein